ncbi:hypothetical protein BO70DRAFT_366820 [Aspergillus heteromorphus CBS 117.55]|uniref:Uncharacterized protein n=1 Tax=Aspergillus heteromorphus CBS 117.55 TaxID=1448321 RepID=A0A317UXL2_9EURO|nr:uncharacterized protein BO70DRAFT_366820 [Aspergillus heteromorphus CBS 117.55]PWY65242.1 hypothetical protein BO70DRAFT_366820 [Aspergillus heteromorphus CBS 117.55]
MLDGFWAYLRSFCALTLSALLFPVTSSAGFDQSHAVTEFKETYRSQSSDISVTATMEMLRAKDYYFCLLGFPVCIYIYRPSQSDFNSETFSICSSAEDA